MVLLEYPDSPQSEPFFGFEFLENRGPLEAKNDGKESTNTKQANFENQPRRGVARIGTSRVNITPFSQRPALEVRPQHCGAPLTRISGDVASFLASDNRICVQEQNIFATSLTNISLPSPVFHVLRPYDEKIEHPEKIQRRSEGMTSSSMAKPHFIGRPSLDFRNSLETSPPPCTCDVTTDNLSLSKISGRQLPEVSGINVDSTKVVYLDERVMTLSEQVSNEFGATQVRFDTKCIVMRLENPPECNACGKLYITDGDLKKHVKIAHGELNSGIYKCNECKATFQNDTNLRRHAYEAHGTTIISCDLCGVGFSTKRSLMLHEKKQHGVVPTSFKRKTTAKQLCVSTTEKKVLIYYECLFCDYSSTVKGNVVRHFNGKHLNKRPYECQFCGKRGKTKQNIAFHEQVCQKNWRGPF